jgi:hypothetical protein
VAPTVGLGLLVVPAIGHAASEGMAWAPLAVGAAGGGLVVLYGHRPIHRWYAAGAGLAGLWAAAAWWVGLGDPIVATGYVALLVTAVAMWVRRVHPRARVRVEGGSVWPWHWERFRFRLQARRDCRRAMESWRVASYWGRVPRSEVRAAVADIDEDATVLTVELVPGHLALDLDNRRAASAIGAPVLHVVVVQDDPSGPANVVLVEWYRFGLPPAEEEFVDPESQYLERLRGAVAELGPRIISARKLAREAAVPAGWMRENFDAIGPTLGLRRVSGGWQRLGLAAGGEA